MDKDLVSMAQSFSGLPIEDLIGGPLNAVTKANAAMALTQTKFLLDTCFNKVLLKEATTSEPAEYNYNPIMIKMSLDRASITYDNEGNANIQNFTTSFNLPLLTIVPLNSLAVDTASVDFEMEVKSSFSEDEKEASKTSTSAQASLEGKLGWGPVSVSIKGSASYSSEDSRTHDTHYEKSNSAKYTISVHASQIPLPRGVNTIIDAFAQAIQPIEGPNKPDSSKANSSKSESSKAEPSKAKE